MLAGHFMSYSASGVDDTCPGGALVAISGDATVAVTITAPGIDCRFAGRRDGMIIQLTPGQSCVAAPRRTMGRLFLDSGSLLVSGSMISAGLNGSYLTSDGTDTGRWSVGASGVSLGR